MKFHNGVFILQSIKQIQAIVFHLILSTILLGKNMANLLHEIFTEILEI